MKLNNFADRLIKAINIKGNPCIVGLDPRLDLIPEFILNELRSKPIDEQVTCALTNFHIHILDAIKDLVPAVKPQIAFYEQYGLPGLVAFQNTISAAKTRGLFVIVDAKRNDIGSTAEAYANAFLGKSDIFGIKKSLFDVDALTVNPYLGSETIVPFVKVCKEYGKGIFVLVKTSNPGSGDIQDKVSFSTKNRVYIDVAKITNNLGNNLVGEEGYSSIGAVVGATYPGAAEELRVVMKNNIFLVPGYGAQGAKGQDIVNCFNSDGYGAIINASRSITYSGYENDISKLDFLNIIYKNTKNMIEDVTSAIKTNNHRNSR
jgi:orotidine-5'-phosphate decarboxylase